MAKRQVYSFVEKKYSSNGIASAVLSVLSVLVLLALLGISFLLKGRASSWIGAMGIAGIIMAFLGLSYGFSGFKDDCKSYFCCKLGTILSTVAIAAWFFIVCIGIAQS
jgi:hypothetical protein